MSYTATWVELCVKLTIDKDKGYLGVMTSLFTPCMPWYYVLRNRKFIITATLPDAGNLLESEDTDTYLMYREFYGDEIKGKVFIYLFIY